MDRNSETSEDRGSVLIGLGQKYAASVRNLPFLANQVKAKNHCNRLHRPEVHVNLHLSYIFRFRILLGVPTTPVINLLVPNFLSRCDVLSHPREGTEPDTDRLKVELRSRSPRSDRLHCD
jgi:hypothetical protein